MEKLWSNLDLATEIYMNRVSSCPYGDSTILLFKGADSRNLQDNRKDLQAS